ncbi:MAG: HEAT repeat domain-containing protein [Planctomycetota bacterium]
MRTLLLVALLASTVLADEAADLFYRAFWLEQSGRGNAEAEKLYRELIDKHGDAPEAPRAYLALIRMRSAKGVKVDEMLNALEKGYPGASKEIELARKLAARLNVDFDAEIHADDAPLLRKLKTIYTHLLETGKIAKGDEDFLQDVGAAGHTMLSAALRSSNGSAVYFAARSLARQNSKAANQVLIRALQDESVLYRLRIIDSFHVYGFGDKELTTALHDLWPRASRSMRRRIAIVWARGTMPNSSSIEECYRFLATALNDEDDQVRVSALSVNSHAPYLRPAVWSAAALRFVPSKDGRIQQADRLLPWQVAHEELRPRIEKSLIEREGPVRFSHLNLHDKKPHGITAEMADCWMRIALARSARDPLIMKSGSNQDATRSLALYAAFASNAAARSLLRAGLERGEAEYIQLFSQGFQQRFQGKKRWDISELGDLTDLKRLALERSYAKEEGPRAAASYFLRYVPLSKSDLGILLEVAKAHPDKGLPAQAMSKTFFGQIGPEAAASLVSYARESEIKGMLSAGHVWFAGGKAMRDDRGLVYWKTILPRTRATHASQLGRLDQQSPELARAVALRVLSAREPEWAWKTPSHAGDHRMGGAFLINQSGVRAALSRAPLRDALYRAASDERLQLAELALRVARGDSTDAALVAFRAAIDSPWEKIREQAVRDLSYRAAKGAALLEQCLREKKLPAEQRDELLKGLARCAGKAQLNYVRERLDQRVDGVEAEVMWDIAFAFDRDASVERALVEVFGKGPPAYHDEALSVLCRVSDERRIDVFRKVLRNGQSDSRIHTVLRTVADQYLIELGAEVLIHLRNPNVGIRNTATKAIERLKFYAEAKKLFEKEAK